MTVADANNAPKAPDMCTIAKCDGETPMTAAAPDGTTCDVNGAPSTCQKGKCALPCTMPSDCPSMGPCQTVACNGATGSCEYTKVADGTPTPGVTPVAGDCKQHICLMGQDTDAPDDADIPTVPAAMAGCADAKCNNGTPSFPLHAPDSGCSAFMGNQPGFCSATGECSQCTQDSECAGTGLSNDCQHPACQSNVCAQALTAANTPTTGNPAQVPADCAEIVCDGNGGTTSTPDATDVPSDPTGCNPGTCTGSPLMPGHGMSANGTGCGGGLSCSNGVCSGCTMDSQCQTGGKTNGKCTAPSCSCTPFTCASLGLSCGTALDGCGGTLNCNDAKLDGNETAVDCGGNARPVRVALRAGPDVQGHDRLPSGLTCADGVCCNQACGGSCEACTAAKKGQGIDGVCHSVAAGRPTRAACAQSHAASSCGQEGATCNGSGACTTWPTGTVCAGTTCMGSTLTKPETCVAARARRPGMASCSPYKCVGQACGTGCTQDTDCISNGYSAAGARASPSSPRAPRAPPPASARAASA